MAVDLGYFVSHPSFLLSNSPSHVFSPSIRSSKYLSPPPLSNGGFSGVVTNQSPYRTNNAVFSRKVPTVLSKRIAFSGIPRCTGSSSSDGNPDDSKASPEQEKVSFGNSRKDVLLIGVGVTLIGFGLKSGLEYVGVDPLQAGNVVQLVLVLGLTVGWISTYIFRVSNKEMTYAQQLRDYEKQVMQKRIEGLTEAELEALLEQVEEEKRRLAGGEQV